MKRDQFINDIKCLQISAAAMSSKAADVLKFAEKGHNIPLRVEALVLATGLLKASECAEKLASLANQDNGETML